MPLPGYGLLIGTVVSSRPQSGGNPHWLLMVQPAEQSHPPYRVAVNLQSSVKGSDPQVEFQAIDVQKDGTPGLRALVQQLKNNGATPNFIRAADDANCPTLDFVRGGIVDLAAFQDVPEDADPFRDAFVDALTAVGQNNHLVAVFGTGYPNQADTGKVSPTGYQGIDNIHMNQGSFRATGGTSHYLENGAHQDGGLIFLLPTGAQALFVKFHTQSTNTDAAGNPVNTGIEELDATHQEVRKALFDVPGKLEATPVAASNLVARKAVIRGRGTTQRATSPLGPQETALTPQVAAVAISRGTDAAVVAEGGKFIFADENPEDATAAFVPEDDNGMFRSKFVVEYSRGQTKGPVPKPRRYPTLDLSDILGPEPIGVTTEDGLEEIQFDMVGDSGATTESKLPGEMRVTELMTANARKSPPAFLFHLGDVVYFYGEGRFFYSQFYDPFRAYPAPILAIPGNHDAITFDPNMKSLEAFEEAFCAEKPGRWEGAGGILRSTMIQPGVYFTLDAPLVSIIGLYSNCSESIGWLDEPQVLFLYQELVRLKGLRERDGRAVILAVHHCPRWFDDAAKDLMTTAIDNACKKADFWPDAVTCGHAHLYQRIVRHMDDSGQDIPYLIAGAGGYGLNALQELGKTFTKPLEERMKATLVESGYLRVTVTGKVGRAKTLRFEYWSTKDPVNPKDTCEIDLALRKMTKPA